MNSTSPEPAPLPTDTAELEALLTKQANRRRKAAEAMDDETAKLRRIVEHALGNNPSKTKYMTENRIFSLTNVARSTVRTWAGKRGWNPAGGGKKPTGKTRRKST